MKKRIIWGYLIPGSLAIIGTLIFFWYFNGLTEFPDDTSGTIHCSLDFGDGYIAHLSVTVPKNETIYLDVSVPYNLESYYSPPSVKQADISVGEKNPFEDGV